MRRLLSAVLLMVFLFNLGGYYAFFSVLRIKASRELSAQLDQGEYDEQQTIEVNLPLTLPYPIQGAGFERSKQFFTIGEEHYQVVKHKYENDVLTIVCVKDERSKDFTDLIQSMDEQQSGEDGKASLLSKVIQEFVSSDILMLRQGLTCYREIEQSIFISSAASGWNSLVFSPPRRG